MKIPNKEHFPVTSWEIIDYLFNATNIRMFEAINNYKMGIGKHS